MVRDDIFSLLLWARSNPNPKLKEEVDSEVIRGEEELDLKDAEVDDEVNGGKGKGGDRQVIPNSL